MAPSGWYRLPGPIVHRWTPGYSVLRRQDRERTVRTEGKGQARAVDVDEGAVWEGFLLEEGPGLAQSLFSGSQQEMSFSERELGQGLPGSPRDLGLEGARSRRTFSEITISPQPTEGCHSCTSHP